MELFRTPHYLVGGLLALAASVVFGRWAQTRRRRILERFASSGLLPLLFPQEATAERRRRYALRTAALTLIFVSLAGIQWGVELHTVRAKGIQVMIAVDTSRSMLAVDLKPNRMEKAKSALSLLIDGLQGNRVGLIAFAGKAFIQCPLTTDTEAAKSFLRRLQVDMIPARGTAIGNAIGLATQYLSKYPGHKAIILLTDGEDHTGDALAAAQTAAEKDIHLFIIGTGTPEGEPIPIKENDKTIGYVKDEKGETVVSRLAEQSLIQLAAASGGAYYRATPLENEVSAIMGHIADMEKSDLASGSQNRYKNRYRYPLFAAFLLLLIEMLPPVRPLVTAGAVILMWGGCGLPSNLSLHRGKSEYDKEKYDKALERFQKADSKDVLTQFNKGASHYKLGAYDSAKEDFNHLADSDKAPKQMAPKAYYNLGNTLYRLEDIQGAAQAYKRCLILDPKDEDCRHNLVVTLRPPPKKKEEKDKKDEQKNKDKKDQEKEKEKKKAEGTPDPKNPTPQERKKELTKEQAKRILQALREKEKEAAKNRSTRRVNLEEETKTGGATW